MKIDFYTDTFKPEVNGVVTQINVLRGQLKAKHHQVKVFAPVVPKHKDTEKGIFRLSSVKVTKRLDQRMAIPVPTKHFRNAIFSKPDIIHVQTLGSVGIFAFYSAKTKKCPYVLSFHTLLTQYTHYFGSSLVVRPWMMKRVSQAYCQMADWIIAPSPKIEKEIRSWGVKKPISVVSNGVEVGRFNGNKNFLISKGFVEKGDRVLLYVGRVAKEKNLEFLIRVYPKIKKVNPKVKLVIVGEGHQEAKIKKMAKDPGIIFTGLVPPEEIASAYASGDVFLFSSNSEVQPFSIMEALAAGLPIVALKDIALEGMVINGVNGYQVTSDKEFISKVVEVLDPKTGARLGKNSKKLAKENFSAESSLQKHLDIYRHVIKNHKEGTMAQFAAKEEKSMFEKLVPGAFASIVVVALIGVFFAFNMPTDIKAAPGKIKGNAKELAIRGAQKIKIQIDKVEETVRDIR